MDYESLALGLIVGGYVIYTHVKLRSLERRMDVELGAVRHAVTTMLEDVKKEISARLDNIKNSIPSVEQLAREVIKVKIPVTELPEDFQRDLEAYNSMIPGNTPIPPQPTKGKKHKEEKPSYVG